MYLEHYGLKLKPFQTTADPEFLWLGEKHREALALVRSGIMVKPGFVALTGEAGTGKTVLIKRLISEMDVDVALVTLTSPDLNREDFYDLLSKGFEGVRPFDGREELIHHLRELHQRHAGRKQLLIIDEAQQLNQDLLEEIQWLSEIKFHDRKLIDIFFVGQAELYEHLLKPKNRDWAQRITVHHRIEPLEEREIAAYIEHRLERAGCTLDIFKPAAIFVIYELTGGIPRLINIVCDHALQTGAARRLEKIDENVIRESAAASGVFIIPRSVGDDPPPTARANKNASVRQSLDITFPPQNLSEDDLDPIPEYRGKKRRWLYAVPFLLLMAYLAYPFNYFATDEDSAPNDNVNGALSNTPSAKLSTELMPSVASVKENRSSSLFDDKFLITFEINSNELDQKSLGLLDTIAKQIARHPEQSVIIRGYTDSSGPIDLNLRISRLRAETVKSYLVDKGAVSDKIEVIAMGPENPIASNNTSEGRRQNRRVEIEFP